MPEVRIVTYKGKAVLVEWTGLDGAHRAVVPGAAVADNEVDLAVLEMGIPYGLPWEELVPLRVTPEDIARELRRRGIWTSADLAANPTAALAALQSAYGIDLAALRRAAERYDKEQQL